MPGPPSREGRRPENWGETKHDMNVHLVVNVMVLGELSVFGSESESVVGFTFLLALNAFGIGWSLVRSLCKFK